MELLRRVVGEPNEPIDYIPDEPLLAPGKYRPLTISESVASVKDTTVSEPYFWAYYDYAYLADFDLDNLNCARLLYGPSVHILTRDMALQFAGQNVCLLLNIPFKDYCLPFYDASTPVTTSRSKLLEHLFSGVFHEPMREPRYGDPCEPVAYRLQPLVYLVRSSYKFMDPDPYLGRENWARTDSMGVLRRGSRDSVIYVFAEKLD